MSNEPPLLANFIVNRTYDTTQGVAFNVTQTSDYFLTPLGPNTTISPQSFGPSFTLDANIDYKRTGGAYILVYFNGQPLTNPPVTTYTSFYENGEATLDLHLLLPMPSNASAYNILSFQAIVPLDGISTVVVPPYPTNNAISVTSSRGLSTTPTMRDLIRRFVRALRRSPKLTRGRRRRKQPDTEEDVWCEDC